VNAATLSGLVVTAPTARRRLAYSTTAFDLDVLGPGGERVDRFHVISSRDAISDLRHTLHAGDAVTVTGHLRSEPFDMPDRSVWYRVELVARSITRP
jgi:hypothetical protein